MHMLESFVFLLLLLSSIIGFVFLSVFDDFGVHVHRCFLFINCFYSNQC